MLLYVLPPNVGVGEATWTGKVITVGDVWVGYVLQPVLH